MFPYLPGVTAGGLQQLVIRLTHPNIRFPLGDSMRIGNEQIVHIQSTIFHPLADALALMTEPPETPPFVMLGSSSEKNARHLWTTNP